MKSITLLPFLALISHVMITIGSDLPRGVPPSAASLYANKNDQFTCLDKSRTISFSAVNDDYCDCPDGSDEPGTAACSNSTYYCHNMGHIAGTIPSSRVNDGICDPECCDGSDEYDGKVNCPNQCDKVSKEYHEQQNELARILEQGLRIKQQYRSNASANQHQRDTELKDIELQLNTLTTQLSELKTKLDTAETDERNALDHELKTFMDRAKFLLYGMIKPKKDAETARKALEETETKLRELESKRNSLQLASKVDIGNNDSAWFALVGKCFTMTQGDYTYELCPFQGISQRNSISGPYSATHSLGKWGKWVDNESAWQYDHGDQCWSGPIRNTKITLECGDKELIKDLAEPIMCEYTMTFITPAACKDIDSKSSITATTNNNNQQHEEL